MHISPLFKHPKYYKIFFFTRKSHTISPREEEEEDVFKGYSTTCAIYYSFGDVRPSPYHQVHDAVRKCVLILLGAPCGGAKHQNSNILRVWSSVVVRPAWRKERASGPHLFNSFCQNSTLSRVVIKDNLVKFCATKNYQEVIY